MIEEPRRSGRSTKGQHKSLELVPDSPSKKPKSRKHQKEELSKAFAEPTSDNEEIIRCICGEYEEEEDIERDMICCDQCSAWQHNDCMGLVFAKGEEPDEYFCEICKPENHKVLLDKVARGEKPWEEAAEKRRQTLEAEKASRRKKGKRGGRRSKANEVQAESGFALALPPTSTSVPPSPASLVVPTNQEANEERVSGPPSAQKRKLDANEMADEAEAGPKLKHPRVSPQLPTTVTTAAAESNAFPNRDSEKAAPEAIGISEEVKHLARKSASSALVKLFVDQISEARKRGTFTVPDEKSVKEIAQQLGVSIESAMYRDHCGGSGEPTEAYKTQLRTILFNVKKNPSLRDRLLVGTLSPDTLSRMSSQDMASEELQQKDAEIKRESERQHIIVRDQGPRIRRTHKGEELIEEETHTATTESIFSATANRRGIVEADSSPVHESPGSPQTRQLDQTTEANIATYPHPIDKKTSAPMDHDQHIAASVESPVGSHYDREFPEVATHIREPLAHGNVQADADIDKLLQDEEPESPPYSPKDFDDGGIVWRGKIVMNPIAEFSSSAKHVGGADLNGRIPWSQLAPYTLNIDGRIDVQLASNYLCGLRFSSSTDVTVMAVTPPDVPSERAGFDKLFNYFVDRKRYGVVGKHLLPAVKDTYIVPVEAGSTTKPEFIELLDNNSLESPTQERKLLVVFAVKTADSVPSSVRLSSHLPSQDPNTTDSPVTTPGFQPQKSPFSNTDTHSVTPVAPALTSPNPVIGVHSEHRQQSPYNAQLQPGQLQYPSQKTQQVPLTGIAAAIQVLGSQSTAPAVQRLLQQAPNADVNQLGVVRDILVRQPEAAFNFEFLMQALIQATSNGHQQNGK